MKDASGFLIVGDSIALHFHVEVGLNGFFFGMTAVGLNVIGPHGKIEIIPLCTWISMKIIIALRCDNFFMNCPY